VKGLIFLGCIAAAAGCAQGHPAPDDSLARPVAVTSGDVTESSVTFTIEGGFAQASEISMNVAKPSLRVHTSGDGVSRYAEIDAVTLPLGDVTISAEALPPKGIVLRNLVVKTGAAHATILHAQDDALELRAKLPLSLEWAIQLDDGSLYQLGTVRTDPINLDVQVVRGADGHSIATVQAACLGTCWSVDGVAKLSDGAVYLQTEAELTWSK
jgi:hypothetical protein